MCVSNEGSLPSPAPMSAMNCLIIHEVPGRVTLVRTPRPVAAAGEVLVEAELSAISQGTELRLLGAAKMDSPTGPYVPGYCLVGRVVEADPAGPAVGTRVLCPGGRTPEGIGRQIGRTSSCTW